MDDYDWMALARELNVEGAGICDDPGCLACTTAATTLRTEIERDFVPRGEVEKLREALKDLVSRGNAHLSRTALGGDHG